MMLADRGLTESLIAGPLLVFCVAQNKTHLEMQTTCSVGLNYSRNPSCFLSVELDIRWVNFYILHH